MISEIAENPTIKKNKFKLAYFALLLIWLSFIFILFLIFAPKIIVQKKIAAIKAKGDPVSMKDLAGPKIPVSQNGAVIYEKIFKILPDAKAELDAYNIKGKYGKQWYKNKSSFSYLRKHIPKYNKPLALLDEASALPKCRFKVNWDVIPYEVKFKSHPMIRNIVRILQLRAVLGSYEGNKNDSVKDVGRIFKLSDSLKQEPTLISQLVRYAVISVGHSALIKAEYWGNVNEKQARELDSIISKIDIKDSYLIALKGERALGIEMYKMILEKDLSELSGKKESKFKGRMGNYPIVSQFIYFDENYFLDQMQGIIDNSLNKPKEENLDKVEPKISKLHVLSSLLMPVYSKACKKTYEAQTNLIGCRIFLGLQAYKDRYGVYPDNLNLLKTKLNWTVAKDPFGNNDFIYKKSAKGFLLYSIGPNLKNDGGLDVSERKKDSVNYDIIWKVEK